MKKLLIITAVLTILLLAVGVAVAENPIKITVNGVEISTDVPPEIKNGRTMVPIRVISESLGYNVNWDDVTKTVKIGMSQEKFKAYHDVDDFLADYQMAIQSLREADANISEAFQDDNQNSGVHLTVASGWLSTALSYEKQLYKYEEAVAEIASIKNELNALTQTRLKYQFLLDGAGTGFKPSFPSSENRYFDAYRLADQNAHDELNKLEDEIFPRLKTKLGR
jgi:hypothetical protein